MRAISLILAALAVVIVLTAWLCRHAGTGDEGFLLPQGEIRVRGVNNTLVSVARQVSNPDVFSYDPKTRNAVSHATLIVEGELQLGRPGEPASGECLEMATEVCGDLRIEVRPTGTLRLDYSTIRTVSQVLSNTACSRGYALFVDGSLLMDHSRISYLSGSTSQCLRRSATARIRNSSFAYCDGSALSCVNVDGSRITIDQCELMGSGNWGLIVQGTGGAPLTVRDTVFDSQLGDLLVTGESAEVHLVDCAFDPAKIIFSRESGRALIQWTRRVKVIDADSGQPVEGAMVQAEPIDAADGTMTTMETTSADGQAKLVLTERVVLPDPEKRNASPPIGYRLTARSADGARTAGIDLYEARGKEPNPIVIEMR